MSEMSLRQKAAAAVVITVVLYAIAVFTWFVSAEAAWTKARRQYNRAKDAYQRECKRISEKKYWADAYEQEKAAMPSFEGTRATDTTWLKKMDDLAVKHNILISQRQAGREVAEGDVLELPIEVKQWEGSLEALARFMHDLENTNEGMFDISQLSLKPSSKKGYLRGSFTLNCAYMRDE